MSVSMTKVVQFIKANQGVVLKEWVRAPNRTMTCRAVFKASSALRHNNAVTSPIIKAAIDEFYPYCTDKDCRHALFVSIEGGREFIVLESNYQIKVGGINAKLEYPTYHQAAQRAYTATFLGVAGVMLEGNK